MNIAAPPPPRRPRRCRTTWPSAPHRLLDDGHRHQVGLERGHPQPLQGQAVGRRHVERDGLELARARAVEADPLELLHPEDIHLELLLEILAEAREPEGRAEPDEPLELGLLVEALVVADRPLDVLGQVAEDRAHSLEDVAACLLLSPRA